VPEGSAAVDETSSAKDVSDSIHGAAKINGLLMRGEAEEVKILAAAVSASVSPRTKPSYRKGPWLSKYILGS